MDLVPDGKEEELATPAGKDLFGSVRRTTGEKRSTTSKGAEVEILKPKAVLREILTT